VAVQGGFYETEGTGGEKSVKIEEMLAVLDGEAAQAIDLVARTGRPPDVGADERMTLALFMAVQMTRTPETRERLLFATSVQAYANQREIDRQLVADYVENVHLGFRPHEKEIEAALIFVQETERRGLPTKDDAIHLALSTVDQLATILLGKRWSLEIARRPRFLTSDAPLIIWRKTFSPR
jgi:hypothetical protein